MSKSSKAPRGASAHQCSSAASRNSLNGFVTGVREIAKKATTIVTKFSTLEVNSTTMGKPLPYTVPSKVNSAIARCSICSPRFFEKQGIQATEQVRKDLLTVAGFIENALKIDPSLFQPEQQKALASAAKSARELAGSQLPETREPRGGYQAFVVELDPGQAVPVDLTVTAQYRVTGVGPIEAIVKALQREHQMTGSVTLGHFRQAAQRPIGSEDAPLDILMPISLKSSDRQTLARVQVTIDPAMFGGVSQTLTNVVEFLRDQVSALEADSFQPLDGTDCFCWSAAPTRGITVSIITTEAVRSKATADELVRETSNTLEQMIKLERVLDAGIQPKPRVAQPA